MRSRHYLLGLAAGALMVTGAEAADLPAPEPVDYVRICDAFGAGFYYIPGTETCIRIGGFVRAQYAFGYSKTKVGAAAATTSNMWSWYGRGAISIDTRTNTEYGLLRTFILAWTTRAGGSATGAAYVAANGAGTSGSLFLWDAFIQFGGLTAGQVTSFFSGGWGTTIEAGPDGAGVNHKVVALAYTFAFGNGMSASIALEAPTFVSTFFHANVGIVRPDIVANVRVDQGWGSAQLSVMAHHVRTAALNTSGWSANLGASFNIPSANASIFIVGMYGRGNIAGVLTSYSCHALCSDINTTTGGLATAWGIAGGASFALSPQLRAAIEGQYIRQSAGAVSFRQYDIQGNLVYSPVAGLSFTFFAEYRSVNAIAATGTDVNAWLAGLRIQRAY